MGERATNANHPPGWLDKRSTPPARPARHQIKPPRRVEKRGPPPHRRANHGARDGHQHRPSTAPRLAGRAGGVARSAGHVFRRQTRTKRRRRNRSRCQLVSEGRHRFCPLSIGPNRPITYRCTSCTLSPSDPCWPQRFGGSYGCDWRGQDDGLFHVSGLFPA